MSSDSAGILSSLLDLLAGGSLSVNIILTDSKEVIALRDEVQQLREDYQRLLEDYNRTEFRFRCESIISQRLLDYCREQDVVVPKAMFQIKHDG